MSEDIVARLKSAVKDGRLVDPTEATDEIERLRTNLSEALRLMEPAAEIVRAQDDERLPDTCTVLVPIGELRAIAAFVKRMKGE